MSHYIIATCIGTKDAGCVDVCPVDCIHPRPDEPDFETERMLYIDKRTCIDCGLCIDECPVQAIFREEDLPVDQQRFVQINDEYFAKQTS
jgi:ferredoxin--NADP+ reductase